MPWLTNLFSRLALLALACGCRAEAADCDRTLLNHMDRPLVLTPLPVLSSAATFELTITSPKHPKVVYVIDFKAGERNAVEVPAQGSVTFARGEANQDEQSYCAFSMALDHLDPLGAMTGMVAYGPRILAGGKAVGISLDTDNRTAGKAGTDRILKASPHRTYTPERAVVISEAGCLCTIL